MACRHSPLSGHSNKPLLQMALANSILQCLRKTKFYSSSRQLIRNLLTVSSLFRRTQDQDLLAGISQPCCQAHTKRVSLVTGSMSKQKPYDSAMMRSLRLQELTTQADAPSSWLDHQASSPPTTLASIKCSAESR